MVEHESAVASALVSLILEQRAYPDVGKGDESIADRPDLLTTYPSWCCFCSKTFNASGKT